MGISNSDKYTISKHAVERIIKRFNVPKTRVQSWTQRFLSGARFFQDTDEENLQIFKKDAVLMVLNVEEHVVITAYPYNPFNKSNGLSSDILARLQPSFEQIINAEKISLRDELDGMMMDLNLSFQAYQSHPRSKKMLEEFAQCLSEIQIRLLASKNLIKEIDSLQHDD